MRPRFSDIDLTEFGLGVGVSSIVSLASMLSIISSLFAMRAWMKFSRSMIVWVLGSCVSCSCCNMRLNYCLYTENSPKFLWPGLTL